MSRSRRAHPVRRAVWSTRWLARAAAIALGGAVGGACRSTPTGAAPIIVDLTHPWVHASPAALGMDSAALDRAVATAAGIPRFRALLVARHGRIALERYFGGTDTATRFDVRSVTKSVVSLLTGIALAGGALPGLDARVGDYLGPPYVLDDGDRAVTVRELLTMTSGYAWNEAADVDDYDQWIAAPDHVQYLLDRAQTGPPGPFVYNSAAVHLLGVILQRAEREPLPELAAHALLEPAGITSAVWEPLENGTVNGGSGLALTARDLLRIGQLALQDGQSGDRGVVPAAWVREVTTPRFTWRETVGPQPGVTYGYLWWVTDGPPYPAYFAWGFGGQFIYVVPALDLVAVATTEWRGITSDPASEDLALTVLGVIVNDVLPAAHRTVATRVRDPISPP